MRKLEYYREGGSDKHLRDIRGMLQVSGGQIDHAALEEWTRSAECGSSGKQLRPDGAGHYGCVARA